VKDKGPGTNLSRMVGEKKWANPPPTKNTKHQNEKKKKKESSLLKEGKAKGPPEDLPRRSPIGKTKRKGAIGGQR